MPGKVRTLAQKAAMRDQAVALFAKCEPYYRIKAALMADHGVSERTAKRAIAEARATFQAQDDASLHERRCEAIEQMKAAIAFAYGEGDIRAVMNGLRHLHHLWGVVRPDGRVVVEVQAPDMFEGRSDADLIFYVDHGYFPEDAPREYTGPDPEAKGPTLADRLRGDS